MSFEDGFLNNMDRNRKTKEFLHPNIEKAHRRTEQIFKNESVDMDSFKRDEDGRKGVYSAEEVEADKQKAKALKLKFRENENEVQRSLRIQSEVAEGLIYRGIGKYQWFSNQAKPIKTSDYDDYINGVDVMVEFGDQNQAPQNVAGLMIDITFSADRNTGALDKKFERIKKEIEEGHLSSVKYFQSKNDPRFRGTFSDMPRVIIGMERSKVLELSTLWVNEDREQELLTHSIQRGILEQIWSQLQSQEEYAASLGNDHLTNTLRKEKQIIKSIIESKNIPIGDMARDEVHRQIMDSVKGFGSSTSASTSSYHRPKSDEVVRDSSEVKMHNLEDYPRRPKLSLKK